MERLLNIKSGESKTIDILNKIKISKIAICGEQANIILNQIINNECDMSISLLGHRIELFKLNLIDLIKPSDDYHNWKLCIFKLKDSITFPNVWWGKNYNGVENKIKVEFKSQDKRLNLILFYKVINYEYS